MIMKKLVKDFSESELKELEGKWLFCRVDYNFDEDEAYMSFGSDNESIHVFRDL